jgi:hypothetical protein
MPELREVPLQSAATAGFTGLFMVKVAPTDARMMHAMAAH